MRALTLAPALPLLLALAGCEQDYKLAEAPAVIAVSPTLADLGAIAVGASATVDLTLTSISGGEVEVVALDLLDIDGGGFSVPDTLPTVPAGGTATLTVTYTPVEAGFHLAQLTVTTNEGRDADHVISVRGQAGTAAAQVWPLVLDFGPVPVGGSGSGSLTLANTGDITFSADTTLAPPFSLVTLVPADIAAGSTGRFAIEFSPTDAAEASGTLEFDLGGVTTVPLVTLRGNACGTGTPTLYDADSDGYTACAGDCDDADASAHPGGTEVCDGRDQDCDGTLDEGTSCSDDDGDGVTEDAGDCNDGAAAVSPSAAEILGNGIDDDCDGVIDAGTHDDDADGYAEEGGDCDLADATAYPGAPELADGVDNDCDGLTDEGTTAYDDDGDGVTEDAGDCDDADATVYPGAAEAADGVDDDCDAEVDEGTDSGDDDRDGYTEAGGDCDDGDAAVNPGAREVSGDGTDNNCDGATE
ncbi:MAG: MopE-related protein [Pseudomonadota bacterium]|nr:MopE-related protein [Pseudomonadota bacterium]